MLFYFKATSCDLPRAFSAVSGSLSTAPHGLLPALILYFLKICEASYFLLLALISPQRQGLERFDLPSQYGFYVFHFSLEDIKRKTGGTHL
jgi:hypothetical protein